MRRSFPYEFPHKFKWAIQLLFYQERQWFQICRIDNYPHDGQYGVHIHICGSSFVKKLQLDFVEAQEVIMKISQEILRSNFQYELEW